jgi:hypothetical protein
MRAFAFTGQVITVDGTTYENATIFFLKREVPFLQNFIERFSAIQAQNTFDS